MSQATDYLVEQIRNQERLIASLLDQRAVFWDEGFTAAVAQHAEQQRDPSHPFTRANPYSPGVKVDGWLATGADRG